MSDSPNDKLSVMQFGEALQRFAQADPREVAILTNASMKDGEIERLIAAFEKSAQFDENGIEFWSARTLALLLEYFDYRNFLNIVEKTKIACANAGQPPEDHFVDAAEMVELGSGVARQWG